MVHDNQKQIAGAILIAGILIAGAILLKDSSNTGGTAAGGAAVAGSPAPIGSKDRTFGNPKAKVAVIMYEDFQCPFCGMFFKDTEKNIRDTYVANGSVELVYRDFPFLGTESTRASEAARCAEDQGKFWEYHDYLFTHQKGENQGTFSDANLKSFAGKVGLDTAAFNACLDGNKYEQAVTDAKTEASKAGVTGTPKGYILRDGKVVSTIDGAEPLDQVKQKIDSALK